MTVEEEILAELVLHTGYLAGVGEMLYALQLGLVFIFGIMLVMWVVSR